MSSKTKAVESPQQFAGMAEAAYPRRNGEDLRYRLVLGKGHVLIIDDQATDAVKNLKDVAIPNSHPPAELAGIYEFYGCPITATELQDTQAGSCGISSFLKAKLIALGDLQRFDLILLDLSLGEGHGADPLGYQLLPFLRKFFPLIPIVAYTKYRDMGHIERAFRRGASWFLSKDEAGKLPAHHMELIDKPHWDREWNAIKERVEWDLPVGTPYDDATLHLIWKTVEHLPGGRVFVRELRGGIGGAKTLHASREINGRYDRAAPIVIKIDDKFAMLLERERYQRFIQPYLSNLAGRIDVPLHVGGDNHGAISYTYAGTSQGRRDGHREVIQLAELLQRNLPKSHQDILPASNYEPLFQCLLVDILARIHTIDPLGEPSELDFPNLVYDESPISEDDMSREKLSGSPLDTYMMRMPAEFEVLLESRLDICSENTTNNVVYVNGVEHGNDACIKGLAHLEDGLLHRVDIKGTLGSFYAEHRYLRPMQPLWVDFNNNDVFENNWLKLWNARTQEYNLANRNGLNPNELIFSFIDAGFDKWSQTGDGVHVAQAIRHLYKWLTKKGRARKALEEGHIGIIHGDMNLGNVMVERERGGPPDPVNSAPWLIDFARTKRDWIVFDYTQLELDICMRLVRPEFFGKLEQSKEVTKQDWSEPDAFVDSFLETPWREPTCLKTDERLAFIYRLMRMIRDGADNANVKDVEYLASRVWQCLITHKILCGKWRKKKEDTEDPELQFRCVWSLKQAFQTARLLGWNPRS
ncbi:MAG: hypothetical protein WCK77_07520 [Verrucomicrobiota bacterium]